MANDHEIFEALVAPCEADFTGEGTEGDDGFPDNDAVWSSGKNGDCYLTFGHIRRARAALSAAALAAPEADVDVTVHDSSGDVFADLGLPSPFAAAPEEPSEEGPSLSETIAELRAVTKKYGVSLSAAAPAGEGWRPIESAPKNGTWFLAFGGGCEGVQRVSYLERTGAWDVEGNLTLDDYDTEPDGYCRPTHWMPLPAPHQRRGKK
jgi:hypothetical protein